MEDEFYGDSYLCRKCNHESLKVDFGPHVSCPECGSQDVVNAKFWRRFSRMSKLEKIKRINVGL